MGARTIYTVAAVLVLSAVARADKDKAKDLFRWGTQHYNLGDYREALNTFRAAYREFEDPAILFNVAQCHRLLKEYERAATTYRAFLREQPGAANREEVERLIEEMERAATPAAEPLPPPVDSAPTAQLPPPAPAPPILATPSAEVVHQQETHHRPIGARAVGWSVALGGLVIGVAGAGLGGYSLDLFGQARRATILGDQRDLAERSTAYRDAGWALVGVGSAAVLAGTVVLAIDYRRGRR